MIFFENPNICLANIGRAADRRPYSHHRKVCDKPEFEEAVLNRVGRGGVIPLSRGNFLGQNHDVGEMIKGEKMGSLSVAVELYYVNPSV